MPEGLTWLLLVVVFIALAFDYVNGFHDAANAIATVVSTRALSPRQAVLLAGTMNFAGAFWSAKVANTMAEGLVDPARVTAQQVILGALIGALLWNLLTWWLGLPSSSSHALVGGLIGAVGWHTRSLTDGIQWLNIWHKVILPGLVSPVVALLVGFCVMASMTWVLFWMRPHPNKATRRFRMMQRFSAALMAFSHGTADAQKVMGVITLALITNGLVAPGSPPPWWVKTACALMIALGTSAGGWRIIKTMGRKIFKLQPPHGFAADLTSSLVLQTTAYLGMPLSTTHVITGSIMGVGASKRISAVRWGVAKNILAAWVFTIPASAMVAAVVCMGVEACLGR